MSAPLQAKVNSLPSQLQKFKPRGFKNTSFLDRLFLISALGVLVFTNYKFQSVYNEWYRLFLVVTVLTLVFCRDFVRIMRSRNFLFMVLALVVLLGFRLMDHGDRMDWTLYHFARAIPFYFVGYRLSRDHKKLGWFLIVVILAYTIVCVQDYSKIGVEARSAQWNYYMLSSSLAGQVADTSSMYDALQIFIYHYPYLALLTLLGYGLYDSASWTVKISIFCCQVVLVISCVMSAWSAPLAILLAGGGTIAFCELLRGSFRRSRWVILLLAATIFLTVIFSVALFYQGATTRSTDRFMLFAKLFSGEWSFLEWLDQASGTRISLMNISLESINKSPLLGVGNVGYSMNVGGHSDIIDNYARFGLLGGIPLTVMIVSWIVTAVSFFKKQSASRMSIATLSFIVALCLGYIFNPYLFNSNIDLLVFLVVGIVSGGIGDRILRVSW